MFATPDGAVKVAVRSKKRKIVALVKQLTKKAVEKIQEEHQQAIEENDSELTLINNDPQGHDHDSQIQAIQYKNVGLQVEIREKGQEIVSFKRSYVGCLANQGKSNGLTIIAKNNETAEYPYISTFRQHSYRRHKTRVLLAYN